MVVLIDIVEDSSAYEAGLRKGDIGTITLDWYTSSARYGVAFQKFGAMAGCPPYHLRKIDPPQAADGWKHCVWKPKVKELA
jgi:hypothetical protein